MWNIYSKTSKGDNIPRLSMAVTIYHNPRCSKSRQALKLLNEAGVDVEIIEYLKHPPDAVTIDWILDNLALQPRQLMRKGEARYCELELDNQDLDRNILIESMINNPILIERPIVISNDKVRLGRPAEAVLEII